jgi:hypothetical protein
MTAFGRKADIAIGPITNCERLQDLLQKHHLRKLIDFFLEKHPWLNQPI